MKVAIVHNSEEKSKQVTKQLTTLLEQNTPQLLALNESTN